MSRSQMNSEQRSVLALLVAQLYAGECIGVKVGDEVERYLCFRLAGERLPTIPGLRDPVGARAAGLFISAARYLGRAPDGNPDDRIWMQGGSLDEIELALEDLAGEDDVSQFLSAYRCRAAAMGLDAVFSNGQSGTPLMVISVTPSNQRMAMRER